MMINWVAYDRLADLLTNYYGVELADVQTMALPTGLDDELMQRVRQGLEQFAAWASSRRVMRGRGRGADTEVFAPGFTPAQRAAFQRARAVATIAADDGRPDPAAWRHVMRTVVEYMNITDGVDGRVPAQVVRGIIAIMRDLAIQGGWAAAAAAGSGGAGAQLEALANLSAVQVELLEQLTGVAFRQRLVDELVDRWNALGKLRPPLGAITASLKWFQDTKTSYPNALQSIVDDPERYAASIKFKDGAKDVDKARIGTVTAIRRASGSAGKAPAAQPRPTTSGRFTFDF